MQPYKPRGFPKKYEAPQPGKMFICLVRIFPRIKPQIFYEGTDIKSNKNILVAELLTIQNGKFHKQLLLLILWINS